METKFFRGFDCTIMFEDQTPTGFIQVFEWLKSGKKIRNSKWENGKYIHIVNDILVNQNGEIVQNICFNVKWEIVKPLMFEDLKPGQKFIFNNFSNKNICTKLNDKYYHCPKYIVYTIINHDIEVTLA